MPFKEAMTGSWTASLMRRTCSRYSSGPSANSAARGMNVTASAKEFSCGSTDETASASSLSICSSKSERMTMAEAPASSSRGTESRVSASGEAPAISGESSFSPRYSVLRSMGALLFRRRRRGDDLLELLVDAESLLDVGLGGGHELLITLGTLLLDHAEARLVAHVRGEIALGRAGVELEGALAEGRTPRVVAIERPVSRLDGELLLLDTVRHVIAVRDALAVRDDQGRSRVCLRLLERLHRLDILGAEGDARHVDVAVAHRQEAQVLLRARLAGDGELRRGADGRRLRRLAARVRVHLGVEHQDVHLSPHREHVVEATVADVVGPAVAADDPDALLHQVVGQGQEALGLGPAQGQERLLQRLDPRPLVCDPGLGGLIALDEPLHERGWEPGCEPLEHLARLLLVLVGREPHAQAKLGVVLEERVRPGGAAAVGIGAVRRGGQVPAVDRAAAGRVGDEHAIAVELRHELDVRRLAATRARARELEQRLEELRALDVEPHLGAVRLGQTEEEVEVGALGLAQRKLRRHVDGLVLGVGLVLGGADHHAQRAPGAILGGHLDGVLAALPFAAAEIRGLVGGRRARELRRLEHLGPDGRVRADQRALVALDAEDVVPDRG